MLWIWECKDYPDRNVKVDELEEFQSKLVQVGANKGTVVTRRGFQKGSIAIAKSFRMGLMTLQNQLVTVVQMSQETRENEFEMIHAKFSLDSRGRERSDVMLQDLIKGEIHRFFEP